MNDRGQYGRGTRCAWIGAEDSAQPAATPWWKIAAVAAVVLGAGYWVTRPRPRRAQEELHAAPTNVGTKLRGDELTRVRGGVRY